MVTKRKHTYTPYAGGGMFVTDDPVITVVPEAEDIIIPKTKKKQTENIPIFTKKIT